MKNIIECNVNVVKFLLWRNNKEKRGMGVGTAPWMEAPPPYTGQPCIQNSTLYKLILGSKTTNIDFISDFTGLSLFGGPDKCSCQVLKQRRHYTRHINILLTYD